MRFQDYLNYAAEPDTLGIEAIERFDELFRKGAVRKVFEVRPGSVQIRSGSDQESSERE